jgi:hypothetical protein
MLLLLLMMMMTIRRVYHKLCKDNWRIDIQLMLGLRYFNNNLALRGQDNNATELLSMRI